MSDSIAPIAASAEARPRASLEQITTNMANTFKEVDTAYSNWGRAYTQQVDNLLPKPSESRHMRNLLNSINDPTMKGVMEHSLKMSDKMNEFNRMFLKNRAKSSSSSNMMGTMLKASGLTVSGIKQLLSAQ